MAYGAYLSQLSSQQLAYQGMTKNILYEYDIIPFQSKFTGLFPLMFIFNDNHDNFLNDIELMFASMRSQLSKYSFGNNI